jgi:hypothetical protein
MLELESWVSQILGDKDPFEWAKDHRKESLFILIDFSLYPVDKALSKKSKFVYELLSL